MQFVSHAQEALSIAECDAPTLKAGQVRVAVKAFGINRADLLQRAGKYPPPAGESEILGLEMAGEIIELGEGVTQWQLGDRVCGLVAGGGYAEEVAVNADHLMPLPDNLSWAEGAGLTEVFITAFQVVDEIGQLQRGQSALIHGGASGVGLAALQLCRAMGVTTATTASSEEKLALCRELGAAITINYKDQDFANELKRQKQGADLILDMVGGDYLNRNLSVLNMDGKVVYLAMLAGRFADQLDLAKLLAKRGSVIGSTLRNRTDAYKAQLIQRFTEQYLPLFESGELVVNLDSVYSVHAINEAHEQMASNNTKGKLVVTWLTQTGGEAS